MSTNSLTYLKLPEGLKRRAKMAAAGLGKSMSAYVAGVIEADCVRLGIPVLENPTSENAEACDE